MRKFKLNDTFETVGGFWEPDKPAEIITGTLSVKKGKTELLVSPKLENLDGSSEEIFRALTDSNAKASRLKALIGNTRDGDCTLFDLIEGNGRGIHNFPKGHSISADTWRASALLLGLHIPSIDTPIADGAAFHLTQIQQWLPTPWHGHMNQEAITYISPNKALEIFAYKSESLSAEVICEVFSGGSNKFQRGIKIVPVPRIRVVPQKSQSIRWLLNLAPRLENFFTLLLGVSSSLKRLHVFAGKEEGWVIRRQDRPRGKFNHQSTIQCPAETTYQALEHWLSVPEDNRPVEKTVLGMIPRSSLFEVTRFLALTQALEGFCRLHFSDDLSFMEMCKQSYDVLDTQFAKRLLGEKTDWSSKLVQTRNYFTHLGQKKGGQVVDDDGPLFLLNQRLQAFIRALMLIDLGFNQAVVQPPITYQANRWKFL